MPSLVPNHLYTSFEVTESPESGENVPVVISWWHHPDPDDPDARAGAAEYRDFIRLTRMNQHMAHHLIERPGGPRTFLGLIGTQARVRHHPLTAVLESEAEFPTPNPFPMFLGHTVVNAEVGMYVLVADPLPAPPHFSTLISLVNTDPNGVGMARIELRADDAARHHYASLPPTGPSEELVGRVLSEEDPALREGLRLVFGIPRPGQGGSWM